MSRFTVLHVCLGNICRSPMAERLFTARFAEAVGPDASQLVRSVSAGTGDWHVGEAMNPPAARQLLQRGASDAGFTASTLDAADVRAADLLVTATAEHVRYVARRWPEAAPRLFQLREFARLVVKVEQSELPSFVDDPAMMLDRGRALVAAADALRGSRTPDATDDVDDPWERGDAYFTRVADEIEDAVTAIVRALVG